MLIKNNFLFMLVLCAGALMSKQIIANEINFTIKDNEGNWLEDAIITATPTNLNKLPKQLINKQVVDQVDKEFIPYVMPIYLNTLVHFPNSDDIRHHVYSFSAAKKFELPLYTGNSAPPVLFDKPGIVILGCNIHDWMIGYIYVSETPYFETSNENGYAKLQNLPIGDYNVQVWHPRMLKAEESSLRTISITTSSTLSLEWQLQLKPKFKIPRPSTNYGLDYR